MGLRAPVLVGGALAGGLAYADEPVTIEPIDGGYKVEFAASGTTLYARDKSTILLARASTAGITLDDKTGDVRVSMDETGTVLESIAVGPKVGANGLKTEWITLLVGGRDETLTVTREESCDDGPLLTIDGANGEIRVDDCASGGRVILTSNGIKADAVDMPLMEVPGSFFVAPPRDLVVSPSKIGVRGLDVDRIVFVGESAGTRIEGLHAHEAFFEGTHHGVSLAGGIVDYLQVDGTLTGAALPGTTIGQYVGPSSFQATPPLPIIKVPGGGPK